MTKPLEQIQIENRKFILEATGAYRDELKLLKQAYNWQINEFISESFFRKPLTLSMVLLALKDEEIGFYDDCLGKVWKGHKYDWDIKEDRPDRLEYVCDWDLKKETLEEQSEETQRKINKLFNNIEKRNNK